MISLFKKTSKVEALDQTAQNYREAFDAIREKEVQKADTRIVNFKVRVGCGCGGKYEWYHAEVPIDADIQDGDYSDFEEYMTNIQTGRTK